MRFKLVPSVGVNDIKLGDQRDVVNSNFQSTMTSVNAMPWDTVPTDYYDGYWIRFSYDDNNCLESFGFEPETEAEIVGISLATYKLKPLLKLISSKGYSIEQYDDGHYIDRLGLCVFSVNNKKIVAFELYKGKYLERANHATEMANKHFDL